MRWPRAREAVCESVLGALRDRAGAASPARCSAGDLSAAERPAADLSAEDRPAADRPAPDCPLAVRVGRPAVPRDGRRGLPRMTSMG